MMVLVTGEAVQGVCDAEADGGIVRAMDEVCELTKDEVLVLLDGDEQDAGWAEDEYQSVR